MVREYVHVDERQQVGENWLVIYEPLDYCPILHGSLRGTIYDGCRRQDFYEANGKLFSEQPLRAVGTGWLSVKSGRIWYVWHDLPHEEHFLLVQYQREASCLWMKEGF